MKESFGFILVAAAIMAVLFFLSSGRKQPFIPLDVRHDSITTDVACTACHGPGKAAPLKPSHPPKEQCMVCHKVKKNLSSSR